MLNNKCNNIRMFGIVFSLLLLVSCIDKSKENGLPVKPSVPVDVTATINWASNREVAVNSPDGGYKVYYSLRSPVTLNDSVVDVPYDTVLKKTPTTSNVKIVLSGRYFFAVQAYSSLNPPSGSESKLSSEFYLDIQ